MIEISDFSTKLADFHLKGNKEDPLYRLRQRGWDTFLEKGLPTKKSETYQYIKLRKLFAASYKAAEKDSFDPKPWLFEESRGSNLVFVNGFFSPEHSEVPDGLDILPLNEAIFSFGTWINNQWAKTLKEETDPFALLNSALFSEGALLYISPKAVIKKPIQLLFVTTEEGIMSSPRVEVFLGKQAEVALVSRHVILKENSFTNLFLNAHLEDNAKLTYTQVATECALPGTWVFDATRAHIKRDSNFTTHMATQGSETTRFDYQVEIAGENASCHLNGIWMLRQSLEAHVHVLMKHLAPNCTSLQLFKGALADSSRSSFEGKILVKKEAQKTDSFQLNNNLLLSDHAQANSKPNLEIFADDVKASHGATVGQLDSEELFYLRTRGYTEQEAKGLLTRAFLRDVLSKIEIPSVKELLIRQSDKFLE